jgi:tetratricopeptide (TPR) repeat protein
MESRQLRQAEMVKMHLEYVSEVVKKKETEVIKWFEKGIDLGELGRHNEAITCFNKALEIDPQLASAWYNKGVALGNLGRDSEALTCFNKTLEIDTQFARAWIGKGMILGKLGRYDEAITCCDKALEIDPQDASAWEGKGWALGNLGRHDEALTCFNKALKINPQDTYAWICKGIALGNLGRYDEAITCVNNALKCALNKPEDLLEVSSFLIKFYSERISNAIAEENMGTARQLLDKVIELKSALELHKIPEKKTSFNQQLMDFFIELLKKKKIDAVLELIEILDKSKISKYTGFLFPLKILAQYLQTGEEDILNRQRPEVKGIIKEVLSKILS